VTLGDPSADRAEHGPVTADLSCGFHFSVPETLDGSWFTYKPVPRPGGSAICELKHTQFQI
jgi:hypothetical protein